MSLNDHNFFAGSPVKMRRAASGTVHDNEDIENILNNNDEEYLLNTPSKEKEKFEDREKKTFVKAAWLLIPSLVLLWYMSAVMTVTTSKKIMNLVGLPYLLCTTQFLVASFLTFLYTACWSKNLKPLQSTISTLVYQVSTSYTLGFVFTNVAFSIVSASFAETVKSAEPLSSILLGHMFLNEGTYWTTYLTLIPICAGVAISSFHDESFNTLGILKFFITLMNLQDPPIAT